MKPIKGRATAAKSVASTLVILISLAVGTLPLSGCLVAGVSSGGGFFIWPGSIGLVLLVLLVVFILRRR